MRDRRLVSPRFPCLPVRLEVGADAVDIETLVDTGFTGDIVIHGALPTNVHSPEGRIPVRIADGSVVETLLSDVGCNKVP